MSIPCREAFSSTLLRLAKDQRDIVAVTSDARGSVLLSAFASTLPDQFIEVGIAEQNAIGIAAGLASCGKNVFVCGPASFYCSRSLEQIKHDVAYSGTNVKIAAVSGGVAYGALGSTHHSLHDIAVLRAIPDIGIILPADARQTEIVTAYLAATGGAVYMRMGRSAVPEVYGPDMPEKDVFRYGKGNVLRSGTDVSIIACGQMVHYALTASDLLAEEGISARVIDLPTIKPLDTELIELAAEETGGIVTVEEHSIHGGLGAGVAETCVQACPVPMRILGIPDEPAFTGNQLEIFEHYGLSGRGIRNAVAELIH